MEIQYPIHNLILAHFWDNETSDIKCSGPIHICKFFGPNDHWHIKDKFLSEIQSKIAKILTAYFCDLNDFENSKKKKIRTSYLSDAETQFFRSGSDQYRFGLEQYFSTVFRITQILLRIIRITTFSLPDQLPYGFFRMTEVGCMRICFPQIFQFAQICTLNFYIF